MFVILIVFSILAGMALPTQFSINAQLRNIVGSPVVASTVSFMVGAVALLVVSLFGKGINIKKEWFEAPWWVWTGGLLGAFYVVATVILIPRIGAAATVSYIFAGQMIASVLIDHFGIIGVQSHSLSLPRLCGLILVLIGVVIVQKF
jgi:transporter family-2 protein